jgi:uncharacterized protein (DUF433 family)
MSISKIVNRNKENPTSAVLKLLRDKYSDEEILANLDTLNIGDAIAIQHLIGKKTIVKEYIEVEEDVNKDVLESI